MEIDEKEIKIQDNDSTESSLSNSTSDFSVDSLELKYQKRIDYFRKQFQDANNKLEQKLQEL